MPQSKQIRLPIQLLVEGNDQRNFFEVLVKHLSLRDIQIHDFGGVTELGGFLRAFVDMPNFSVVRSIGIVRDAEKSATSASQSIQSSLANAGLLLPYNPAGGPGTALTVKTLILPGGNRQGMLETLLLESIAEAPVDQCIDDFFDCVQASAGMSVNRTDKARARAYILTKPEPHVSVGVAAQKGYWDLGHSVFSHVRSFLQQL